MAASAIAASTWICHVHIKGVNQRSKHASSVDLWYTHNCKTSIQSCEFKGGGWEKMKNKKYKLNKTTQHRCDDVWYLVDCAQNCPIQGQATPMGLLLMFQCLPQLPRQYCARVSITPWLRVAATVIGLT